MERLGEQNKIKIQIVYKVKSQDHTQENHKKEKPKHSEKEAKVVVTQPNKTLIFSHKITFKTK